MAWPHRYNFEPRSAGEVKAFKCLASRKGVVPLVNMHKVNWTSERGVISLVNAREVIQTLKKEAIPLGIREVFSLKKWHVVPSRMNARLALEEH